MDNAIERYSVYGKLVDRGEFFVWDCRTSGIVHPVTGNCSTPTPWALSTVEEAEAAAEALNAKRRAKALDRIKDQSHGDNAIRELTAAMDNVLAWRMGEACNAAHREPAGDLIDRGLALLRHLNERGFQVYGSLDRIKDQSHGG